MSKIQNKWFAALLSAAISMIAAAQVFADQSATSKENEQKLIAVLKSDAPPQEKAMTCKKLVACGTKDAVPALAALLADEQLAAWARTALEAIPDPAVDNALRDSLGSLQGRRLVGVINSIAVRRDVNATDALIALLKNADTKVASAAASALGRIGTPAAAKALEQSLATAQMEVRSAVAEGCILCAEKYQAEGKSEEAVKLFDLVRKADLPKQRVLEATRGSILARDAAGMPQLAELLKSTDKATFALGLHVARELPGSDVTEALAKEFAQLTPERQALLTLALSDRNDAKVLPIVREAAKTSSEPVRLAAITALERIGDKSCVSVLLETAQETKPKLAEAAMAALAKMPDKAVDAELVTCLSQAEGKTRLILLQLAGERRVAAANPVLLKAVEDSDAELRAAALTALGYTVEIDNLPVLITAVARPKTPAEAKVALESLTTACTRMPDREACAAKLVAALSGLPVEATCDVLEILSAMGGDKALEAIGKAAKSNQTEIKDAAVRLLGGWMTADAAPTLLEVAKTAAEERYRIRALRGYLRIARQFAMPEDRRIEMCRAALATASREEEKAIALKVLSAHPSLPMLKVAVELAKDPALKENASQQAYLIAQKIGGDADAVKKLLAEAGFETVKVEIVHAEYGVKNNAKDVTSVLQDRVGDYPLIVLRSNSYNTAFGGDPVPNKKKQLKIQYKINGKPCEVSLPEDAPIMLPMPR